MNSASITNGSASLDAFSYHSTVRDYVELLKPRVMSLVVFTGLVGMLLAPGAIHPFIAATAILCIAFGSGAAGAINMWYDRDIDAIMERTRNRPIPSLRVHPDHALEFAIFTAFASVLVMAAAVNYMAAALLLAAILFYVYVYTFWLKRRTPQNIVIGGAAGAFPPMIGWAAVTGTVSFESVLLFLIIFFWTPPHFWALALHRNQDYRRAKIPMLPVTAGAEHTKWHMLAYSLMLFSLSLMPYFIDMFGLCYLASAVLLGLNFVRHNLNVLQHDDTRIAMRMFGFSIVYLFALFAAMVVDRYLISLMF